MELNISVASAEKSNLAVTLEPVGLHGHLCLIYETKDEQFAALAPFIRIGLERNEKCVYVANGNTINAVLDTLQKSGIDTRAAVHSGALAVMARQDAYCQEERFDPDSAIDFLIKSTHDAKKAGFAALRLIGEMTWALGDNPGAGRLKEFETRLNIVLPTIDALAICQYNRDHLDPRVLLDAIHTHPNVVFDGSICRNFYYVPPEEFGSPDQRDHLVERLLRSIREGAQAERALRESEEQFRLIVEGAPDAIFVQTQGCLAYVNQAAVRLYGATSVDQLLGQPVMDRFHPDYHATIRERIRLVSEEKKVVPAMEQKHLTLDGTVIDVEASAVPFIYKNHTGALVFVHDITGHKRVEDALRKSEARLLAAQTSAHIGNWEWNPITGEVYWSDENYRIFGLYPEKVNPSFEAFLATVEPADQELVKEAFREALSGEKPYDIDIHIIRPDGAACVVNANARTDFDEAGKAIRMVGTVQDITGRVQAEVSLRESERRFRSIVEQSIDGIALSNEQGIVIEWNWGMERLTGLKQAEAIGRPIWDIQLQLLPEERRSPEAGERVKAFVQEFLMGGQAPWMNRLLEINVRHADGTLRSIQQSTFSIETDRGFMPCGIFRDVTEQKRAEAEREATRDLLQTAIDGVGDPVLLIGTDHQIRMMNRAVQDNYSANNGTEPFYCYQVSHHRDSPCGGAECPCPLDQVRETLRPVTVTHEHIRQDGEKRLVEIIATPLLEENRTLSGIVEAARDVTERRRMEESEREQHILAEALRDTATALNSTLELDEVLDRILANVGKVVPHDTANFMLLEGEVGHVIRARGFAERGMQDRILSMQFLVSEISNFRQMTETKEPVVIADTQTDPNWTALPGLGWIRSYVGTPIVVADKVIGFLSLDSSAPGAFTLEHAERLRAFAEQAAIAIHNARLYEDAQRRAEELEALRQVALGITGQLDLDTLLEQLVRSALQLLDIPSGGIYLYRPELDMLEWAFSIGPHVVPLGSKLRRGEGLSGKIWETGKPLVVDDYATWEGRVPAYAGYALGAVVGVPIQWGDELLGIINAMTERGHPRKFTERDAHLLSLFADQAAIAIRNARLYEAERRERLAAQTLQKTAESLASTTRPEDTLELIVGQLGQIVAFDRALVMLTDGDVLRIVAARGFSEPDQVLGATCPYTDHLLFREVMLSDKAVSVADVRQDPRWDPSLPSEAATRAWLGAPLTASDISLGMLSISRDQPRPFSSDDLEMIQASARQAALAVRNAHIVANLEDSLTELRQAQSHLARTAQLHVAGELATGIAHQVNNPLTTIIAESYLLLKQLPSDSPGYESAESIKEAAYRAGTVVQRLLDFARSNPYDFQLLDVNDSIRHAVSLVRAQIEPQIARVVVDLQPDLPLIEASREYLEDVWLNLLLNARDAINKPGEGIIKVTARLDVQGNAIEVVVRDNGSGISPEHMERLFNPFFTTKRYGTGLGLAICRDVLTRHGGSIRAESEKGRGARFIVALPLGKNTAE